MKEIYELTANLGKIVEEAANEIEVINVEDTTTELHLNAIKGKFHEIEMLLVSLFQYERLKEKAEKDEQRVLQELIKETNTE